MKWIFCSVLSIVLAEKGKKHKYELQSPKGFHMKALELNETLFEHLIQSHALKDEHVPHAAKHTAVQLKQAFWLIHGARRPEDQAGYQGKWQKFQSDIINYGCHCFVKKFEVGGAGRVADKIDLACRHLHKCQHCIEIDRLDGEVFTDRQPDCHKHVPYFSKLTRSMNGTPGLACGRGAAQNGAQTLCQLANCACDHQFAKSLVEWYVLHYNEDKKELYSDGVTGICKNEGDNIGPPEGCCGEYPDRRAYWGTLQKGCCGNNLEDQVTYDQTTEQCCNQHTGGVKLLGDC